MKIVPLQKLAAVFNTHDASEIQWLNAGYFQTDNLFIILELKTVQFLCPVMCVAVQ